MIIYSDERYDQYYEDVWNERIGIKFERIYDETEFLLALDCFGPDIRALGVTITKQSTLNKIIEKCSHSLSELVMLPAEKNLVLNATFPNLRKLAFVMGNHDLDDSWVTFNENFPKLFCLEFHDRMGVNFKFKNSYVQRIPKLSKFIYHLSKVSFENIQNIAHFINQNKQIKSLSLYGSTELDNLQSLIEWNQLKVKRLKIMSNNGITIDYIHMLHSLESLTLKGHEYRESRRCDFNKLQKLEIHVWDIEEMPWLAIEYPELKEVTIRIGINLLHKRYLLKNLIFFVDNLGASVKVIKFAVCETMFCEFARHIFVGMVRTFDGIVSLEKVILEIDSTVPSHAQDFARFNWKYYMDAHKRNNLKLERKRFRDQLTGTKLTVLTLTESIEDQEI